MSKREGSARVIITVRQGAIENAGAENAIRAKMQGWKMQEWKMRE